LQLVMLTAAINRRYIFIFLIVCRFNNE